jgi:hypothetical protein
MTPPAFATQSIARAGAVPNSNTTSVNSGIRIQLPRALALFVLLDVM